MNSNLIIKIIGYAGSGKTTIAKTIRNSLTDLGIEVTINDIDNINDDFLKEKQGAMKGRKIRIDVIQAIRNSINSYKP